jgi:hypothetical protein
VSRITGVKLVLLVEGTGVDEGTKRIAYRIGRVSHAVAVGRSFL